MIPQSELDDLKYFFWEYETDCGLCSNLATSLLEIEYLSVPYELHGEGPIPFQPPVQSHVEPTDGLLERLSRGRRVWQIFHEMIQDGLREEIEILFRLYGPYDPPLTPAHFIFGVNSYLLNFTNAHKTGRLQGHVNDEISNEDLILEVKEEINILKGDVALCYLSYSSRHPRPKVYGKSFQ